MTGPKSVVIEADGGSRGNPGAAAYGALLRDADTGDVIAEDGTTIGIATNNVAEYRGLIAGLELAREYAPDADIEVRMDSKLVVEQMSGRWKIKHPDMRPLAMEANRLAPFGTVYVWVPRERNKYADRLANEALDGKRFGVTVLQGEPESLVESVEDEAVQGRKAVEGYRGWAPPGGVRTTLVLVRHGETPHTAAKRFSGGLASSNPGLSDVGRDQVRDVARWLRPLAAKVDAVVSSPVRRTLESAEIVGDVLGFPIEEEPGFAEMEFGEWDGLTFTEVGERFPDELGRWLGAVDVAPPGGESFDDVRVRVLGGLSRVLAVHAGRTVVVMSHVTPIKTLVAEALEAPLSALYRMELKPASVTVVSFTMADDGTRQGSLRMFNALPQPLLDVTRW